MKIIIKTTYTYNYDVHVIKVYIKIISLTCYTITLVNMYLGLLVFILKFAVTQ